MIRLFYRVKILEPYIPLTGTVHTDLIVFDIWG